MAQRSNHLKTVIRLNGTGGELDKIVLDYNEATTQRIAQAVIDIVSASMALAEGDSITITEEQ